MIPLESAPNLRSGNKGAVNYGAPTVCSLTAESVYNYRNNASALRARKVKEPQVDFKVITNGRLRSHDSNSRYHPTTRPGAQ
jgi:hypothetical protein